MVVKWGNSFTDVSFKLFLLLTVLPWAAAVLLWFLLVQK